MVTNTKSFECMSNWVSPITASEIIGRNIGTVGRNGAFGRLRFRVREGHIFYFKPELVDWKPPKRGDPGRLSGDTTLRLSEESSSKIQDLRTRLRKSRKDAMCVVEPNKKANGYVLRVYEFIGSEVSLISEQSLD